MITMRTTTLVALLLAACATARTAEPPHTPTPWCFRLAVTDGGAARGCAERRVVCERARAGAIRFSRVVGVDMVGTCTYDPHR